MKIGIINGPNLNLTGVREPEIYGRMTFEEMIGDLIRLFPGHEFSYFQSNVEGEIINCLHEWGFNLDGIILNAGGYTHTSVAIGDAVGAISAPVIEVHMSNVMQREDFRHISYITPASRGIIAGFGMNSYLLAVRALIG